ncbi:hypothetical protein RMATCC62417_00733 [Rhizopus microsporus]|nr:hypothetical protein RMATCC62417_00733 [Rhizopus microsporus]
MSKEQKAEFKNQSQCIQFTLDIDSRINSNRKLNISNILSPSSMVIPNEEEHHPSTKHHHSLYNHYLPSMYQQQEEREKKDVRYKIIPNLTFSAAAEAAALDSLTFNTNDIKPSLSTQRKYGTAPEKVKRPPNAYLLFNRDMRRKLKGYNQGLSSGEISKNISQRWKQLSQAERDVYFKEESRLKQQHSNEHSNFIYCRRSKAELKQAGLLKKLQKCNKAQQQQQQPQDCQRKKSYYKKKSSLSEGGIPDPRGRKKREPNDCLPKHPMSAYLHFAKKMRPIIKIKHPDAKLVDISKQIGLKWRSMSPAELQPWIEIANQDKARYAREMKARLDNQSSIMAIASPTEELDSETIATVAQMVNPDHAIHS